MSERRDEWTDRFFKGWPPPTGLYLPSPLPAEFRRENQDLRIPRKEEAEATEQLENLLLGYPLF